MKMFKMLSFDMMTADGVQKFPLTDGIIINQENSHQLWILELFIPKNVPRRLSTLVTIWGVISCLCGYYCT